MHQQAQRAVAGFQRARRRFRRLDHLARAVVRYDHTDGGRLAAAVTYYSFFAAFSMALLGFAILGSVLDDAAALRPVQGYLSRNLPSLDAQALREARGTAGLVAFVVLPVAGLFWVDALRSSIRAMWRLPQYPGNFFLRQLIDLAVLAGLGLLLTASLAAAAGTRILLNRLLFGAADAAGPPGRWLLGTAGYVLGIGVNVLLAVAALTAVPRLRMRLRRVLGPALFVAAGLELLKTLGRSYVQRAEANPAYQVVAGAVAVLISLSVLNQLVLFAAALTATSTRGSFTDLAEPAATPARQPTPTAGPTNNQRVIRRRGRPVRRMVGTTGKAHPPGRRR
ncbi:trehalose-binding protein [Virgisporangium ochraceum]|uniref:Trehalose-binding protein n=1 Tax=Virgisporangium ochraceum TaxID=65505 RepID=A0A8J4A752_9ACTN|nr:trehalose-binding protein [Virgisporangium ochraceum]